MMTVLAVSGAAIGVGVVALLGFLLLVILWKTIKFAFKLGIILGVAFLLYKAAQLGGFI